MSTSSQSHYWLCHALCFSWIIWASSALLQIDVEGAEILQHLWKQSSPNISCLDKWQSSNEKKMLMSVNSTQAAVLWRGWGVWELPSCPGTGQFSAGRCSTLSQKHQQGGQGFEYCDECLLSCPGDASFSQGPEFPIKQQREHGTGWLLRRGFVSCK